LGDVAGVRGGGRARVAGEALAADNKAIANSTSRNVR